MISSYVLVIEDDEMIGAIIETALSSEGYIVRTVLTGADGLDLIYKETPSLLLLDISLPGQDGISICRALRADDAYNELPIIFISALAQTEQVIEGLDAGGDDYITKPFEVNELKARLRALQRREIRQQSSKETALIKVGNISLRPDNFQVMTPKLQTRLTATEHRLLRYMMEHAEQVISVNQLLEEVWGYPPDSGDADLVRAHVRKLRNKVEDNPRDPEYIHTIHGIGYMLSDRS